ncbi:MAG: hypothetical protein ACI83I_001165 [Bacteroidia bacterium]
MINNLKQDTIPIYSGYEFRTLTGAIDCGQPKEILESALCLNTRREIYVPRDPSKIIGFSLDALNTHFEDDDWMKFKFQFIESEKLRTYDAESNEYTMSITAD